MNVGESTPEVSVIIPAYRSHGTIGECLAAIAAQSFTDVEVIVVDSSPDDETDALVNRDFPWVRYDHARERLYPHGARNRGAAQARGAYLVFTDPDCVAAADWLERLLATAKAGRAVVGGAVEQRGEAWFTHAVHLTKFSASIAGGPPGPRADLATANVLWTRALWEQLGPFSVERWCGDTELSWRALDAGHTLWLEPAARVEHVHEEAWAGFWRERLLRGEDFAGLRTALRPPSRALAWARVLGAPLVPVLLLRRALGFARRSGQLPRALRASPVMLVGFSAWSLGEARAHRAFLRSGR